MPGENYQDWSTTALTNGSADSAITWVEGQRRDTVNNSARSMMAAHAKNRNLLNGSIVTTGSVNAQAFLSGVTYTTVPTGLVVKLKVGAGLTSTGPATLDMDGIGDVAIVTTNGNALFGGELIAGAYVDLLYNGSNWVYLYSQQFIDEQLHAGGGIVIGQQIFSTAGNFTFIPSVGAESFSIECVGAGGGGGGATAVPITVLGGGGGGSGGYSRALKTAADVGGSQAIIVGAGGIGAPGLDGTAGGDTSVGALCLARGGMGGGHAEATGVSIVSGVGGVPGVGDITAAGSPGGPGQYGGGLQYVTSNGDGGSSVYGGGAIGATIASSSVPGDGNNASNYGGGGGGGNVYHLGVAKGGDGSSGLIVITEYAGRGAPGQPGPPGPLGPAGPAGAGTGDVLVTGTPVAGQVAVWADTSHIRGIDPVVTSPSTGDVKLTFKIVADTGWIILNDGSIGDASSGATTRANADTAALFALFWNNVVTLVVQDFGGLTVARGATAAADYVAHRRIVLPKALGRVLGVAGAGAGLTSRALGTTAGAETETQTIAKMATHNHGFVASRSNATYNLEGGLIAVSMGDTISTGGTNDAGGAAPLDIMQPTTFLNVMCKL